MAYRTENCRFYISMMKPDRFSASDIIEIQPLKPLTPLCAGKRTRPDPGLSGLPGPDAV